MLGIALAVAAAAAALALTTAPLATPSKAQEIKMAQVDIQIGRDRYDRRRYDNDATVGIGPGAELPSAHECAWVGRHVVTPVTSRGMT
jgi:hypothetical protein